ncbi:MAG: MOSC N-terminal beta barrel domain-containing protein [Acidobacteriota bacterium]
MWIKEIWRYPVKSLAGESLQTAELTPPGIAGDRTFQVRNAAGRIMTARTRPLLLRHHATTSPDNLVLVDGRPWNSPDVARDVETAAGANTRLVHSESEERFDVLPLLIATDGMLAAVGVDSRRFRPNIIIGGVTGLAERAWEGAQLRVGAVIIGMDDLRARCIMTTFDPDTGKQDLNVLRTIQKEFDGVLGLNSFVISPGSISVGDTVELVRPA